MKKGNNKELWLMILCAFGSTNSHKRNNEYLENKLFCYEKQDAVCKRVDRMDLQNQLDIILIKSYYIKRDIRDFLIRWRKHKGGVYSGDF